MHCTYSGTYSTVYWLRGLVSSGSSPGTWLPPFPQDLGFDLNLESGVLTRTCLPASHTCCHQQQWRADALQKAPSRLPTCHRIVIAQLLGFVVSDLLTILHPLFLWLGTFPTSILSFRSPVCSTRTTQCTRTLPLAPCFPHQPGPPLRRERRFIYPSLGYLVIRS